MPLWPPRETFQASVSTNAPELSAVTRSPPLISPVFDVRTSAPSRTTQWGEGAPPPKERQPLRSWPSNSNCQPSARSAAGSVLGAAAFWPASAGKVNSAKRQSPANKSEERRVGKEG